MRRNNPGRSNTSASRVSMASSLRGSIHGDRSSGVRSLDSSQYGVFRRWMMEFCGRQNPTTTKIQFLETCHLFPLKFKTSEDENNFIEWLGWDTLASLELLGIMGMGAHLTFYMFAMTTVYTSGFSLVFMSTAHFWGFYGMGLGVYLGLLCQAAAPWLHKTLRVVSPEVLATLLFLIPICSILTHILCFYLTLDVPTNLGDEICDWEPSTFRWAFDYMHSQDWVSTQIQAYTVITMIMLSTLVPTRSVWTWILNTLITIVYITGNLLEWINVGNYADMTSILVKMLCQFIMWVTMCCGRYFLEVGLRLRSINHKRTSEKVKDLQRALKNDQTRRESRSTAVEDITGMVTQAKAFYEVVNTDQIDEPDFVENIGKLEIVLEMLHDYNKLVELHFEDIEADDKEQLDIFVSMYKGRSQKDTPGMASIRSRSVSFAGSLSRRTADTLEGASSIDLVGSASAESFAEIPYERKMTLPSAFACQCGVDWEIDLLMLAKTTTMVLYEVGFAMLRRFTDTWDVDPGVIQALCWQMEKNYDDNPYHNGVHGAFVGHAASYLARICKLTETTAFPKLREAEMVVAALAHDVGHPGRNNAFFINTDHPITILYNDVAVLENFHSASLFRFLENPNCNVFINTNGEEYQKTREMMILYILGTDMKEHFENVTKFRIRLGAEDFNHRANADDAKLVAKMCVKCADLGHTAVGWNQHLEWSYRVTEEFYQQGDAEMELGLPVSPLCDRSKHEGFAKSQASFLDFVIHPLFTELEKLSPTTMASRVIRPINFNRYKWNSASKSGTNKFEIPDRLYAQNSVKSFNLYQMLAENLSVFSRDAGKQFRDIVERRRRVMAAREEMKMKRGMTDNETQTSPRLLEIPEGTLM